MKTKNHKIEVPSVKKVGVYAIRNKRNNKYYVGSSNNIETRMKTHRSNLENGRGINGKILNDLISGDITDFEFLVLETFDDFQITESELRNREAFYIEKHDAYFNGYNNVYHSPAMNGYYSSDELLFCRKPKPQKQTRDNIHAMTNKQLLNFYKKLASYGHIKTDNFLYAEEELLKRLNIRYY